MDFRTALNLQATLLQLLNKPFPVKVSYAIRKNYEALTSIANTFESKRLQLCEQHGTISEDGTQYEFTEEKQALVNAEYENYLSEDADVKIHKIDIEEFGTSEISATELGSLEAYGMLVVKV